MKLSDNPYMAMPIEQVKADALHGVSLARAAWRQRDPEGANAALGGVVQLQQCTRVHKQSRHIR